MISLRRVASLLLITLAVNVVMPRQGSASSFPIEKTSIVKFYDRAFEVAVRTALGKRTGPVTTADVKSITEIHSKQDISISDLATLNDFTRFFVGQKGQINYVEGTV